MLLILNMWIKLYCSGGGKELEFYGEIFPSCRAKFVTIPLGIAPIINLGTVEENNFILSVGRSNRDFDFLIKSLDGSSYKLKIITDILASDAGTDNIQVLNNVYAPRMFDYMNAAKCVVIPLKDKNISSGQLVFLQAMQLGKPIIITESNVLDGYIVNGMNGLVIPKTKEALLNALHTLDTDSSLYERLSANGRRIWREQFSIDCMARNVAKVINGTC